MSAKKRATPQRLSQGNRTLHSRDGSLALTPSASPSSSRVAPDELAKVVNNAVHYILASDQHKRAITRADIVKNVLKGSSCSFAEVLKEVRRKLTHVFGCELVDVKQNTYILISKTKVPDASKFLEKSDEECTKQGFIALVLALIMMMEGCVEEEQLCNLLASLGVALDSPDPVLGDVKKWMSTDLVKQLYLDYSKIEGSQPPKFQYKCGPRAQYEFPKKDLLELVCEVHGDGVQPEQWLSVFNDIKEQQASQQKG